MRIAVIIPCFRQAHFLPEALASVNEQRLPPGVELTTIVVAGSEKDHDVKWRTDFRAAAFIPADPRGLSDARNVGIRLVVVGVAGDHDAILPLDADDRLAPGAIESLVRHVPTTDRPWIVSPDAQEFGLRTNRWPLPPLANLHYQNALCVSSLYSVSVWRLAGGYDPAAIRYEDWDFWLRAMRRANPIVAQTHEPTFLYRIHPASMSAVDACRDDLWRAMLRLRHRSLFTPPELAAAAETARAMPEAVRAELDRKRAWWPEHAALDLERLTDLSRPIPEWSCLPPLPVGEEGLPGAAEERPADVP